MILSLKWSEKIQAKLAKPCQKPYWNFGVVGASGFPVKSGNSTFKCQTNDAIGLQVTLLDEYLPVVLTSQAIKEGEGVT